ncbi:unnamed protein product, partial [Ectocarpus sp. 4 AP-2014]
QTQRARAVVGVGKGCLKDFIATPSTLILLSLCAVATLKGTTTGEAVDPTRRQRQQWCHRCSHHRATNPPLRFPPSTACQIDSVVMVEDGGTNQRRRFDDACRCTINLRQLLLLTPPPMATQAPPSRRAKDDARHSLPSAPTAGAAAAATNVPTTRQRHPSIRGRERRRRPVPSTTTAIRALHLAVALLALAGRLVPVQGAGGDLGPRSEWQHPRSRDGRGNKTGGNGSGRWGREARRGCAGAFPRRERSEREGAVVSEEEGGGGWSRRRKGSESMRNIVELAKADARAVRAAGQRQNEDAAAATAAEAEAAWAAAGVGSGGSGGDNAMLFLKCEVNGRVLRAFVDTGAQVTVMSAACAERCGLASRIDKSYAGRAVGVGFARILGRIHDASIRIGNSYLRCSFTVIEHGEIDLLVGLDVLRAHRCEISLSKNRMKFHAGDGPAKEASER